MTFLVPRLRMPRKQFLTALALFFTVANVVIALAGPAPADALARSGIGALSRPLTLREWAPGTFGPPPPPLGFSIDGWDVTAVTMSWFTNAAADTTIIQREAGLAVWTTLATWGPLANGTAMTFTDTGAAPNTGNCYRVLAGNGYGWSSWSWPDLRCVHTRDGRGIGVDRVELFVRIANISDAGTDDAVQVRLQSPAWLVNWRPAGNAAWVDTLADDDFDRGVQRWYELLTHNVSDLSDITEITLDKPGSDAMCVAEVALRINRNGSLPGPMVFRRVFGETTCRWVTEASPLTISLVDLHSSPDWQAAMPTQPAASIASEWLRAQIQAAFADATHGTDARLGGWSLGTELLSTTSLRVYVPLRVNASILGEVQSVLRFDLNLDSTCNNNVVHTLLTATNVDADSVFDSIPILDLAESILLAPLLWHISEVLEAAVDVTSVTDAKTPTCDFVLRYKADGSIGLGAP